MKPLFSLFLSTAICLAADLPRLDAPAASAPFLKLRLDYAAAPGFTGGWVSDLKREAMLPLFESDPPAFLQQSADWLKQCPVDAKVHLMRASLLIKRGDLEGNLYHKLMFAGLADSIIASGDGKTPATAFKVISVDEEYTILNYLGADVQKQSLVEGLCDKMDVTIDGADRTIFFNVSIPLLAQQRLLDQKEKK